MNTRSIRFRLIAWYAGLLASGFMLLSALMVFGLTRYLETDLRRTQAQRARQIADTLLAGVERSGEPFVAHEIDALYAPEINRRFIRVTRPDGSVLYASRPPSDGSFDPAGVPGLRPLPTTTTFRDAERLLIAAVPTSRGYLVEVGAPVAPIESLLHQALLLVAIGLPIVVLVGPGGGYLLVGRALAPVDQMTRKAEQITQHNLSERLPVTHTADELERLALSLNRMIGRLEDAFLNSKRLVADASHELRTPLTVLRAELESIAAEGGLAPEVRERLGSMLEEVERLARIVDQLFALSRLDAGEARAEWTRFDLAELVTTTADQMSLLAEDKGIAVVCDAPGPVAVEGDRSRMKQVVVNLLDNAIKYTPERGAVTLRVAAVHDRALLEVADTGIGIPPDAIPHVFDRFFRVDKARTRDEGGGGLGLSIVKAICTAHGADVRVESREHGGTRFRVTLPRAAGP